MPHPRDLRAEDDQTKAVPPESEAALAQARAVQAQNFKKPPADRRPFSVRTNYNGRTFCASSPFRPGATSNSTRCPSLRDL